MFTPLDSPITVGIVGLGRAGWGLHLERIKEMPSFKVVSVADSLPDRCAEAARLTGCETFSSLDELLERSAAQLVIVATPSFMHYKDVLKVLQSGRHCIAEKPLALDFREADELITIARERELGLFVYHAHLHAPEYHHLKGVIESGKLGSLFSVRACWANFARRWDWQTLKKNGGGQLNNIGTHVLSVVLPLLGSPVKSVFADLRNIKDAGDAEDHVHIVLQTESGVTADVVASTVLALSGPRWMLCGNRGTLISDGKISKIRYYEDLNVPRLTVLDTAAPERKYLKETLPWQDEDLTIESTPVKSFHENVSDVLLGNSQSVVVPESAAEVVRVINLIQKTAHVANM